MTDTTSHRHTTTFQREQIILQADRSFNALTISQAVIDIMRSDPSFTLADAETILRDHNTKTYFIAVPTDQAPAGVTVRGLDRAPRPYWIWVCLHGYEEAAQKLKESGSKTFADNKAKLLKTGFLMTD